MRERARAISKDKALGMGRSDIQAGVSASHYTTKI
jgi:hypothetical protein